MRRKRRMTLQRMRLLITLCFGLFSFAMVGLALSLSRTRPLWLVLFGIGGALIITFAVHARLAWYDR